MTGTNKLFRLSRNTNYKICICQHADRIHRDSKYNCRGPDMSTGTRGECGCKEFVLDVKAMQSIKHTLSVTISMGCDVKLRNMVRLRHGLKKGALSFEVERALRQAMGEKHLDVLMNDREWKILNK